MSVHGEFQRLLSDLAGFLERTGTPGCEEWAAELKQFGVIGRENVSEGATRTLALLQSDSAPEFVSPLEIEEFARLQDHVAAICRAILGR